jgi:hypothetical protein
VVYESSATFGPQLGADRTADARGECAGIAISASAVAGAPDETAQGVRIGPAVRAVGKVPLDCIAHLGGQLAQYEQLKLLRRCLAIH